MNTDPLSWLVTTTISTILFSLIYQFVFRYRNYFSRNGVKFVRGLPVLGTHWRMILRRCNIWTSFNDIYNAYPMEPFVGMYDIGGVPVYLIRDPELIKKVGITDFDHFTNHSIMIDEKVDPVMGRVVISMRDQQWRDMRSTLSPAFTGSKMRLMMPLLNDCSISFCGMLRKEIEEKHHSSSDHAVVGVEHDLKDLFSRIHTDAIASAAFGLQVNSLSDRDNEFYCKGMKLGDMGGSRMFKMLGFMMFPRIMRWLRLRFFTDDELGFFRCIISDNMKYRIEHNVVRHDMINLLLEARSGQLTHDDNEDGGGGAQDETKDMGYATVQESHVGKSKRKVTNWDENTILAQCLIFFLAGFSGTSLTQSFLMHELTVNANIQRRLYDEVIAVHHKLNGAPLTYEVLQSMKYLDQVISETLRRWTLTPAMNRRCNKPYTMETADGNKVQLYVGDHVWLVSNAVHMDAKYWPEPERFDPERFSDERKGDIVSGTYVPFGIGPRNCIGSRYALMGVKVIVYHMLVSFELVPSRRTENPLIISKKPSAALEPENGFWVGFKLRNNN